MLNWCRSGSNDTKIRDAVVAFSFAMKTPRVTGEHNTLEINTLKNWKLHYRNYLARISW
jgi:hypothetical protein